MNDLSTLHSPRKISYKIQPNSFPSTTRSFPSKTYLLISTIHFPTIQTSMDFNSHTKITTTHHQTHHPKPNTSELMSSAKVVAEAAKATVSHESTKVDKGKVAGAAADLLNAASSYGKLEEKSFGKYVDKAENYLHKYHSSHSTTTTTTTTGSGHHSTTTAAATGHTSSHSGGDGHSGNGYGEYIKMAEGFLKKH